MTSAEDPAFFAGLASRLQAYARGDAVAFDDIELDLRGTPFQLAVWQATRAIPRGQTRSYKQIAETVGRPGASRAVGAAMAANPVTIIIPCHRVVGSDGSLCGFGGGLPLKQRLLGPGARAASLLASPVPTRRRSAGSALHARPISLESSNVRNPGASFLVLCCRESTLAAQNRAADAALWTDAVQSRRRTSRERRESDTKEEDPMRIKRTLVMLALATILAVTTAATALAQAPPPPADPAAAAEARPHWCAAW